MLNGFDFARQYPSSNSDMTLLGFLLSEWRTSINQEVGSAPPLLPTLTDYLSDHIFNGKAAGSTAADAISNSVDRANALCFNYHSSGEAAAADAPLYDPSIHLSTSYGIASWLDPGLYPAKLSMGTPLYGRSGFLKNKLKNGMAIPVVAAGLLQKLSNKNGMMAYFEISCIL